MLFRSNPKINPEQFEKITGQKFTKANLEKFKKGEFSQAAKKIEGYKEGQEMAVDVVADVASGITSFGVYSLAVAASPFTGGASIAVGVAAAAGAGALVKTGVKAADAYSGGRKYTLDDVRGISTEKKFIETKANLDGVSLTSYKIVMPDEFVYVADTSRRGEKIALALNDTNSGFLISSIYTTFRSKDENILLPEYLYLLLSRTEFDRYSRFNSWGSARETFDWSEMCRVQIPVPPLEIQQKIVNLFNCYEECKRISTTAREKIKNLCPALVQKAAHSE